MVAPNVFPMGFGTFRLKGDECAESVVTALETGYRHIDTAQMYENQAAVGRGLNRSDVPREDIFVATKIWHDRLGYDDVIETTNTARKALDVDVIDLLYVHWPATDYDPNDTLDAFDQLEDDGVIDHVGLCNFTPELLDEALGTLDAPLLAHQVEMHPLLQQRELHEYAVEHDHLLVAYSPIARGEVFEMPVIQEIADKHGVTEPQVSLAWLLGKENVVPIPGSSQADHIRENWAANEIELDEEDVEKIDAIDANDVRTVDPNFGAWNR